MTKIIYKISLHKSISTKDNRWKYTIQGGKLYPNKKKKKRKYHSTNPKEDSYTNIIPVLTTEMTGINTHFSLISLNINSPVKKTKINMLNT